MSILNLPSTTDDAILDRLSAAELFKYGRTCKDLHAVVQAYIPRAFQLHKLLAPYFTTDQILHFRKLQASTGMLISGSTALQFFARVVYPDSDLDLYVKHQYREAIGRWLLEIGYRYVPQPEHVGVATFEEALALDPAPPRYGMPLGHDFLHQGGNGYIGASCIFTFVKKAPYQKIELISSLRSPLERVLNFHSTCVMNIVAHDKAYAFFPRGTFVERRSLVCARPMVDDAALKKYAGRGWAISYGISRAELAAAKSAFAPGSRYVGDGACWTLPVYPTLEGDARREAFGGVEANAWGVRYNKLLRPRMSYYFVDAARLLHTYLIADDDDAHLHRHIAEVLESAGSEEEGGDEVEPGPPLDCQFAELIKWYREDDYASDTCPLSSAMQSAAQSGRSISHSDLVALLRAALVLG